MLRKRSKDQQARRPDQTPAGDAGRARTGGMRISEPFDEHAGAGESPREHLEDQGRQFDRDAQGPEAAPRPKA